MFLACEQDRAAPDAGDHGYTEISRRLCEGAEPSEHAMVLAWRFIPRISIHTRVSLLSGCGSTLFGIAKRSAVHAPFTLSPQLEQSWRMSFSKKMQIGCFR